MCKKIGIVGSRRRNSPGAYKAVLAAFNNVYGDGDWIVSGGCPAGGDKFAERIARDLGIPLVTFFPKWKSEGLPAGHNRNTHIAEESDVLIACVAFDRTGGTEDTIEKFTAIHPASEVIIV
jgi:hypothetical protein